MKFLPLECVIPFSEPHMTLESATQEASRGGVVWIPASAPALNYALPQGVPCVDVKGNRIKAGEIHADSVRFTDGSQMSTAGAGLPNPIDLGEF